MSNKQLSKLSKLSKKISKQLSHTPTLCSGQLLAYILSSLHNLTSLVLCSGTSSEFYIPLVNTSSPLSHLAVPHSGGAGGDDEDDDEDSPSGPPSGPSSGASQPSVQSPFFSPSPGPSSGLSDPTPPASPKAEPSSTPSPAASPIGIAARRRFHGQATQHNPPSQWWKVREPTPAISDSDEDDYSPGSSAEDPSSSEDELDVLRPAHQSLSSTHSGYPRTFREAVGKEDGEFWREAALSELQSLMENGTWEVVDAPAGCKALRSQWVFTIKHNSDGTVERYKARLVADGRGQRMGVDYHEVFSPTFKPATLRVILALAATHDLHLRSIDFSSAYLNGDLEEEVYMTQPEGFPQGSPSQVLRLKKSLYGLKQAGRQWNKKLFSQLESMGFKAIESDKSCYIYSRGSVKIILPIYVDDATPVSDSQAEIDQIILLKIMARPGFEPGTSALITDALTTELPDQLCEGNQLSYFNIFLS